MIDADQLSVITDKTALALERELQGIPYRHATPGEEGALEPLSTAAEVQLGHLIDWRALWAIYLQRMAGDLGRYLVQSGSGEYILFERLLLDTDPVLQALSTMGFPCRVTLVKEKERGVITLEISAVNYKPGELPAELTGSD